MDTWVLDHLGVVAAVVRELGLVEKIDRRLPVPDRTKVSRGQRVLAFILNGLGFSRDRLYLMPRFFHHKPVERLIGPGGRADDLPDDALGRGLDEMAQYGTTRLCAELA